MPRFYVFTPGSPGYIGTELAVEPIRGGEPEQKGWASDCARMAPGDLIISHVEALEDPRYRDALERWEGRDDRILEATRIAERHESVRSSAELEAGGGCREADWLLRQNADPEVIHAHISEHVHEGCGWELEREERLWR